VQCVLDSEGLPLRLGVEAEPWLVSPNQREAEGLVGQEFNEEEDFLMALETIAEMGARNVIISEESSCFALIRADRKRRRFQAVAPRVDPISAVGAGDVLLAGYLAASVAEKPPDEAVRAAVAAAVASTLELGAGRLSPREAVRQQNAVDLRELELAELD
jgi:fructose-1-phosphate kinase PfkB-like protein